VFQITVLTFPVAISGTQMMLASFNGNATYNTNTCWSTTPNRN